MRLIVPAWIVAILIVVSANAISQESASFRMERVSIGSGAGKANSTQYDNAVLIGQTAQGGSSSDCNLALVNSVGFWSLLGDLPIPVVLSVQLDASDVELSWTGATDAFEVYRGFSAQNVTNPINLAEETSLCATTDMLASEPGVIYYMVLPSN